MINPDNFKDWYTRYNTACEAGRKSNITSLLQAQDAFRKAELQVDSILLMDEFGFPPVVIDDVYKEVLEQAENYKRNLPAFSGFFYPDVEEKVMEAADDVRS